MIYIREIHFFKRSYAPNMAADLQADQQVEKWQSVRGRLTVY